MYGRRLKTRGGIARKLAGLVLASLLASFLVTAAASTWIDLRRQATLETNRLMQTARVIGSLASESVASGDRAESFKAIRSVSQMPGINYARIRSDRYGLLAETGAGARLVSDAVVQDDAKTLSLTSVLSTSSVQVSAPVVHDGGRVGSITLFSQTPDLRNRVLSTIWTTLAGAIIAVVAGLIVAMRMARGISAPLVALAGFVGRVHDTKNFSLSSNIEAQGEVADLAAGIDALMGGIRDRDARLAAQMEGLEQQVAERTGELVAARDAAQQANAAKSDFLAVMSHEIRTPLNGILALSDMLATSNLPQRQQRYADVISKSGRSLLNVINDILDFSKVEAGKMDLECVEVDVVDIAEDVASLFSEKALSKGLDLAVFVDPRLPIILADPTRLRQVIGNLVNNAIKFTDAGGVLITIERDNDHGTQVRFGVHDTGPGIASDKLPSLFEAFTQADQSTTRTHGGTGLGLAICDRLVRSMEGVWALSSTLGEGSTFAFTAPLQTIGKSSPSLLSKWDRPIGVRGLSDQSDKAIRLYLRAWGVPIAETWSGPQIVGPAAAVPQVGLVICDSEAAAEALLQRFPDSCVLVKPVRRDELLDVIGQIQSGLQPRLTQRRSPSKITTTFPGVRVLVVDDSEVNREVAVEVLSRLEVESYTANDGQEAVDRLRVETFDLVLMDGSMPVLDGFEATRRIRTEETQAGRARTAIVALTAHVVGSGADAWKVCGMDGVIHKPFTQEDLVRELTRFCQARAASSPIPIQADSTGSPALAVPAEQLTPVRTDLFDPDIRGELLAMGQGGRPDFVERVHNLYAVNAPLRLAEILQSARHGISEDLARGTHALKSMSLSLGASAVAREASRLETLARTGDPFGLDDIQTLEALLQSTLVEMTSTPMMQPAEATSQQVLDLAISRGELHLVYQPLVERGGQPSGKVEALVRWTHPDNGPLSPDDFIPKLEADGVIARLTDFVLDRALKDMKSHPSLRVAVNASASEFQLPDFASRVITAVNGAGIAPDRLNIEVTETAMLDIACARRTIDALRSYGFGVSLDDFGAGYTSLHALRELRFTTLKIDRSFVERCTTDTASASIIHAVIGVGRALGMKIVCEGVESFAQAEFLRIAGAHYLQGYHFSRPLTIEAISSANEQAA